MKLKINGGDEKVQRIQIINDLPNTEDEIK